MAAPKSQGPRVVCADGKELSPEPSWQECGGTSCLPIETGGLQRILESTRALGAPGKFRVLFFGGHLCRVQPWPCCLGPGGRGDSPLLVTSPRSKTPVCVALFLAHSRCLGLRTYSWRGCRCGHGRTGAICNVPPRPRPPSGLTLAPCCRRVEGWVPPCGSLVKKGGP